MAVWLEAKWEGENGEYLLRTIQQFIYHILEGGGAAVMPVKSAISQKNSGEWAFNFYVIW